MGSRLSASLQQYGPLSAGDRAVVESLVVAVRSVAPGDDIVIEGDSTPQCRLLLDGQAFRHRTLLDGRRQITAFHLRGDIVDLQSLFLPTDTSVTALGACEVGLISFQQGELVVMDWPGLKAAGEFDAGYLNLPGEFSA